MNIMQLYILDLAFILILMVLLWLLSLRLKNSSIVDIFWGTGFVIVCWLNFVFTQDDYITRKLLLSSLITFWGLRLSSHIFIRNWGKPEDFRYQKWRNEAGKSWVWRSLLKVFILQGILLWVIALPLLAAQWSSKPDHLIVLDFIGAAIWLVGFFFEAVGDFQLTKFKTNPENKGKVLRSGVWRYTRHPNYFGDTAQWWGYYLIAAAAGGWWTVISPIIMTFLLVRVSGVILLEKTLETRPGYKEYVESTSSFIPWFPKQK